MTKIAIVALALLSLSLGACVVRPWGYEGGGREYHDHDGGDRGDRHYYR